MPRGIPNVRREVHTGDLAIAEAPDADINARSETIIPVDKPLEADYAKDLAFMEEPIMIRIEPSDEENAPIVVDCWVNGKGAEVLDTLTGKFMEINCLPIGSPITTKRKYVEVLARSREERVSTQETNPRPGSGEDGWKLRRNMRRKAVFSVLSDPNPAGRAWLTRLMAER